MMVWKKFQKGFKETLPSGCLGVNIGPNKDSKNRIEDYLNCIKVIHNLTNYITINISSPNTPGLRDFHDQNILKDLLKDITEFMNKNKINKPLALKVSPDINDKEIRNIIELIKKFNINGLLFQTLQIKIEKI